MDYAEFTKSDREKTAEVLFTWRNQPGWQKSRITQRGVKIWKRNILRVALLLLFASTVLLIVLRA